MILFEPFNSPFFFEPDNSYTPKVLFFVFEPCYKEQSHYVMISLLQTGDNSPNGEETIGVAFRWQTFCFSSWWSEALNPANHDSLATLECMQFPLDLWTHKSAQTSKVLNFPPLIRGFCQSMFTKAQLYNLVNYVLDFANCQSVEHFPQRLYLQNHWITKAQLEVFQKDDNI